MGSLPPITARKRPFLHYLTIQLKIRAADEALTWQVYPAVANPPPIDPRQARLYS